MAPRPLVLCLALLLGGSVVRAKEWPYPAGQSVQTIEGLKTTLLLPKSLSHDKPVAIVLLLHDSETRGTELVHFFREWPANGYVVCAPHSRSRHWNSYGLSTAKKIALRVIKELPIDAGRIHVVGCGGGGVSTRTLGFDEDLKPLTATWISGGGGSPEFRMGVIVPKWAKKRLGVLILKERETHADAVRKAVPALIDKVKTVQLRVQPRFRRGVKRAPDMLTPYMLWWMEAMEGRFVPGDDLNFDWYKSVGRALSNIGPVKNGGIFVYLYTDDDNSRRLQNSVFMDPLVRHYGNQLRAVKLPFAEHAAEFGVKKGPAIIALNGAGKQKKTIKGKINARRLASVLRSIAPKKGKPD